MFNDCHDLLIELFRCQKQFSLRYIKMSKIADLTYQKSEDLILNKAKDFYEINKERLRDQVGDKCRS